MKAEVIIECILVFMLFAGLFTMIYWAWRDKK